MARRGFEVTKQFRFRQHDGDITLRLAARKLQEFRDAEHAQQERARQVDTFLRRIGYWRRVTPARGRSTGYSGGAGTTSKRQMQHEWYGDRSELTWRDREMGETLGLDSDTYVSNWLEHDKG